MSQLALLFDVPPPAVYTLADACRAGQMAGQLAAQKAERLAEGFTERASAFVLGYLREHGATAGEVITDAAVLAGITAHDTRAFGPVYASLARKGLIVTVGYCMRRRGHGTSGGRVWGLAQHGA